GKPGEEEPYGERQQGQPDHGDACAAFLPLRFLDPDVHLLLDDVEQRLDLVIDPPLGGAQARDGIDRRRQPVERYARRIGLIAERLEREGVLVLLRDAGGEERKAAVDSLQRLAVARR